MQNWQKDRNYRKRENDDNTITFIVTIDGVDVEVCEEVYTAYSQADRRERYQAERDAGFLLSLDRMNEDDVPECLTKRHSESAEDVMMREMLVGQAMAALTQLKPEDRQLIQAVVMDGVTEQAYADVIGVRQSTVNKWKKKILKKVFQIMELKP